MGGGLLPVRNTSSLCASRPIGRLIGLSAASAFSFLPSDSLSDYIFSPSSARVISGFLKASKQEGTHTHTAVVPAVACVVGGNHGCLPAKPRALMCFPPFPLLPSFVFEAPTGSARRDSSTSSLKLFERLRSFPEGPVFSVRVKPVTF